MKSTLEDVVLRGRINLVARHDDGEVFAVRDLQNVITDAGEDEVAKLIVGAAATAFDYIALGSDSAAAADSDTELSSEINSNGGSRSQDGSTGVAANVGTVDVTFSFSGALAIKEVGLLNAATNGDMLARQTFSVINVGNNDSLTATWEITAGTGR